MKQKNWLMLFSILALVGCNSSIISSNPSTSSSNHTTSSNTTTSTSNTSSVSNTTSIEESSSTSSEIPQIEHTITIEEAEHGTITINKNKAYKGEEITINITPEKDYELESISIKTETETILLNEENIFIMPDNDVTISAKFSIITSFKIDFYNSETINNGEYIGEIATFENLKPFFPDDILTDVTDISRVGVGKRGGIGLGSATAFGGMKLILNERYRINSISINAVNWSNNDGGLLVNGKEPDYGELEGVSLEYNTSSIVKWDFAETLSTNEVYIHTAGEEGHFRAIIYSITFNFTFDTKYNIQVNESEFGSVIVQEKAYENNLISFETKANAHYKLNDLQIKQGEQTIEINNNSFIMPKGDVTIIPTFIEIPTFDAIISQKIDLTKGKVILQNNEYFEGDLVEVDIIEAPGYQFKELLVKDTTNNVNIETTDKTFLMPKGNVEINASFEEIERTYTASFYVEESMSDMKGNGHSPTLDEMKLLFPEGKLISTSNSRAGYGKRGGMGIGSGSAMGKLVLNFSEDFMFDKVDIVAVKWAANDGSLLVNGLEPTSGELSGASTETVYDCQKVVSYQLPEKTNSITLSTAGVTGKYRCIIFAVTFHLVEE